MYNMPYSDLGAHVDGFIAVVAHTIVLGATSEAKVTGRRADVVLAAHCASQAALHLLKPGNDVSMLRCCNVIMQGVFSK
jgi:methionine aminopeptidase